MRLEKVQVEIGDRAEPDFQSYLFLQDPLLDSLTAIILSSLTLSRAPESCQNSKLSFYKLVFHLLPLNSWLLPSNIPVTCLLPFCRNALTAPGQEAATTS